MILACTVRFGHDEELILAQQLGADAVIVRVPQVTAESVAAAIHRVAVTGLALVAVEVGDAGAAPVNCAAKVLLAPGARDFDGWAASCEGVIVRAGAGATQLLEMMVAAESRIETSASAIGLLTLAPAAPLGQGSAWVATELDRLRAAGYTGPLRPDPADPDRGDADVDRVVSDLGYLRAALQTLASASTG